MIRENVSSKSSRGGSRWRWVALGLVAGVFVALGVVSPASAATADSLTLSPDTLSPGDATTVTATFTTDTANEVLGASFGASLAGGASWTALTSTPVGTNCGIAGSTANCEFNGLPIGTVVTLTATLSISPSTAAGDHTISTYAATPTSTRTQTLSIVGTPDTPPTIAPIVLPPMNEGTTQDVVVVATDPDGDPITLTALLLPSFATFTDNGDGTGLLRFAPGFSDSGPHSVAIRATSAGVSVNQGAVLTVIDVVATAPVLTPIGAQSVAEGASLTIPLSASDADGDAVTLVASGVPGFATFTPGAPGASTTGSITVNPGFSDAGTYDITVIASGSLTPDSETFTLTVTNTDRPPVLDAIGPLTVGEGATLDVTVTGSDPDGDVVSFLGVSLPSFATLTDNGNGTATLNLAPGFSDAGTYQATVAAFNGGGNDPEVFTITVTVTNRPPVLDPIGSQTVAEGSSVTIPVSATDPDGDALQFLPSGLPSFATFTDNGDGTGSITLTPSFTDAGTYAITMLVTDSFLDDTETFTLTVSNVNRAPVITAVPSQVVIDGTTSSVTVSATDPDGDPLTLFAGAMPSWASFVDNGDGTGTFTFMAGPADVGDVWEILVSVEDPAGAGDTTTVEAVVIDETAPTIFIPADISTPATSAAGATVTYSVTALDAVDGDLIPDCLPPSGSTFPIGTTTVSCTVTDLDGNQAEASFQVSVITESEGSGAGGPDPIDEGTATGGPGPLKKDESSLANTGGSVTWGAALPALAALVLGALALVGSRRKRV